jgi:pimeloyl-ACP methyl ester carboxylesterase
MALPCDTMPAPLVLIHGGGLDASSWDLLVPHLQRPVLAVDLPGRGAHPADPASVTLAGAAASVVADIDAAGFDSVVLVGHSLAGCSMPAMVGLLGKRVEHAVFIACTVPEDGTSSFSTLDAAFLTKLGEGGLTDGGITRELFANDLDDEQYEWFLDHRVGEAPGLVTEAVDLAPLRAPFPRTWVRTLHDVIIPPAKQMRFVGNVGGGCAVVDIDAAHMCMISQPKALAAILDAI